VVRQRLPLGLLWQSLRRGEDGVPSVEAAAAIYERERACVEVCTNYLLTRFVLVFMDEDIAPGLAWRPPARRGGGSCCRVVGSDPTVARPAAGFVAAATS
jgi:hypothetical protein